MKKFLIITLTLVLVFALCACGNEIEESPEPENPAETPSEPEVIPEEPSEPEKTPEEIAENCGYMTFEEITAAGYYPDWMQPHTIIIYDENGVPEITEGGELLPEDLVGRPEFDVMPFFQFSAIATLSSYIFSSQSIASSGLLSWRENAASLP